MDDFYSMFPWLRETRDAQDQSHQFGLTTGCGFFQRVGQMATNGRNGDVPASCDFFYRVATRQFLAQPGLGGGESEHFLEQFEVDVALAGWVDNPDNCI